MKEFKVRVFTGDSERIAHVYATSKTSAVKTAKNLYYALNAEVM